MKKKIIFILFIFSSIALYYNSNICELKRLFNSSKNFGIIYSISHCNNSLISSVKKNIKNILINTPFEISARSFLRSGNYDYINEKILNKIKENEKEIYFRPKKINGDYNNMDKLYYKKYELLNYNSNEYKNWVRSHGGNNNLKFADYSQINLKNINNLKLKWVYEEKGKKFAGVQLNPIYKNNVLYFVSGNGKIIAINTINGKKIWSIQSIKNIYTRGIILDENENTQSSLYVPIEEKIYKIDSNFGVIDKQFGEKGFINLKTRSAPIINKNTICAAQIYPASIKCYDKNKGEFLYEINVHPKNKNFKDGGTIWGGIAFDEKEEIIYAVTGNPRPALVGISRPGPNQNTNSLVAIDLKKKKILWSHQDVIHDLWDYDISAPPVIIDLKFDNYIYPAVVAISKIGNVYIFNRENGNSYFDIDYKKTIKSKIQGEYNSPYQIKIDQPKPLEILKIDLDNFSKKTIIDYKEKFDLNHFSFGEFHPPKLGGEVVMNGLHGGVSWPGFSINPNKKIIFVPVNHIPYKLKLELKTYSKITLDDSSHNLYLEKCSSCHGKYRNGNFEYKSTFFNEQEMDPYDQYVPSLVGHSIFNENFNELFDINYINKLHKKKIINKKQGKDIKLLFERWDKKIFKDSEFFYKYNWSQFINSENLPATKPPWGEIAALDIMDGKMLWKKPIGKLENTIVGTPIYGGLATNSGDILIATGTDDNLVYFINQNNGEILKVFEMESGGSAPPIIYKDNSGEKISIISGSMDYRGYNLNSPTKIYTFGLN